MAEEGEKFAAGVVWWGRRDGMTARVPFGRVDQRSVRHAGQPRASCCCGVPQHVQDYAAPTGQRSARLSITMSVAVTDDRRDKGEEMSASP